MEKSISLNQELETAMSELGYIMEDIPEEFLDETPEEEIYYVLKEGVLYEQ